MRLSQALARPEAEMSAAPRVTPLVLLSAAVLLGAGCNSKLTIEINGKGMVNVLGSEEPIVCNQALCEHELPGGAELTLRASPIGKGVFQGWAGDCIGPKAECKLTLDGDATVKARFIKKFKVAIKVEGDGRVQSEDGRIDCPEAKCEAEYQEGEELRLRRQGGKDVFSAYSGDCTDKECSLIVKKDLNVTAAFTVPAGDVLAAGTFGTANLKKPLIGMAFDDKGGWAVVGVEKKQAHIARYDATGKELYKTTKKVGSSTYAPAVAFYGDDVLMVTSGDKSSTISRIAPDGKTLRYNRLHNGCPALTQAVVRGDAIFAAGAFGGDGLTCGDAELLQTGGKDIVVGRFAIEDGAITWISQFGSKAEDRFGSLAVSRREDAWVGYTAGDRGGRLVRLNPAGKAYPEIPFGKSDETEVLDVQLDKTFVNVSGHVYAVVDFGGGNKLGVAAKDGAGRAVWVRMDEDGRHKESKLVARSRCGAGWLCAFDDKGGFARLSQTGALDDLTPRRKKKKKKKKASGIVRFAVNLLGDDGAERWTGRVKGSGFATPSALAVAPDGAVFILGVLEGELTMTGRQDRLQSRSPAYFWIRLKG
jgi:hypothetical protein